MANVKVYSKVGQRSGSHFENLWYQREGLVIRNTHANMKALSVTIKKLYTMLKFVEGQTDRQTDRQSDYYRAPTTIRGPN